MILPVPFYSQHLDVVDPYWQSRACGMACIKMLLESTGTAVPSLDAMIARGNELGAYGPTGWIHAGLIQVAHSYGASLERKEWRLSESISADELNTEGVNFVIEELHAGRPVIVSAIKKFVEADKFHMVILVGLDEQDGIVNGFYYNDPDTISKAELSAAFVSFDHFKTAWRKMAIVKKAL